MSIADSFAYRADILIFTLTGIIRPIAFLFVWQAVVSSGSNSPFSMTDFSRYYILSMIVGAVVAVWSSPFISSRIRQGRISPYLLKPFSYISYDLGQNVGEKFLKFAFLIPIVIVVSSIFKPNFYFPNITTALLLLASTGMAFVINYLFDICVALTAFWIDETSSLSDFLDLSLMIFSGRLVPLQTLPQQFSLLSLILPFRYSLSFPIEIYLQKLSSQEIMQGFVFQLFWVCILVGGYKFLWTNGLKKYSAVGA